VRLQARRICVGALVLGAAVMPATTAAATPPVLGSPDYLPNGSGFGTAAPTVLSNGGDPNGVVTDIVWSGWGQKVANGRTRMSIFRPQGGYFAPVSGLLRVEDLGTCPGHPEQAYTTLRFRAPQWPGGPLGPWLKWSGSKTMCDYGDMDPAYEYPAEPAGECGDVHHGYKPGNVFSIESYALSCASAQRVARAVSARAWPSSCARSGCTATIRHLRCTLERVHAGETTPALNTAYPAERVACVSGKATMTAWRVLPLK
jgi:hypothetical protein